MKFMQPARYVTREKGFEGEAFGALPESAWQAVKRIL